MFKDHETYVSQDRMIKVLIQSTRGKKEFSFSKVTKISFIIKEAIDAFGFKFTPGDRFELVLARKPGQVLQAQQTLAFYEIADGDVLTLTAVGGGV